jgi:hypothetical protein
MRTRIVTLTLIAVFASAGLQAAVVRGPTAPAKDQSNLSSDDAADTATVMAKKKKKKTKAS